MTQRTCGNCRWWRLKNKDLQIGLCHRVAPSPMIAINEDGEMASAYWPSCCDDHSCSEWADTSITPEQEERRERVRRFAVALLTRHGDTLAPYDVWRMAAGMADAEPQGG